MTHWSEVGSKSKTWTETLADVEDGIWTEQSPLAGGNGGIDFIPLWTADGDWTWSDTGFRGIRFWKTSTITASGFTFDRNP